MNNKVCIGKSECRKDAYEKVIGKAKYVADICLENLKHGVVLRSIHHHAIIEKINTSLAIKLKGVIDIITFKDLPAQKKFGVILADRPALANTKVRFMGEPIAIVIAESREAACKARDIINVKYRLLPTVFDPTLALSNNSEKIHKGGNLISSYEVGCGSVKNGRKLSHFVFEETFRLPTVYPGYLETEASIAECDNNNNIVVWVSSQKPFEDRIHISKVLGVKENKIEVKTKAIGGAFGGKEDSSLAIIAALAAWKIKGKVKFVNDRSESILAHPKRHACILQYKVGATSEGKIKFIDVNAYLNAGAYTTYSPSVSLSLAETATGVYNIPNVAVKVSSVYTNTLVSGAMRGFGAPQSNFAIESMLDIIAEKLKIDSIELRKKNIFKKGDKTYAGAKLNQGESIQECLVLAQKEIDKIERKTILPEIKRGIGLALANQAIGFGHGLIDKSTNSIECLPEGYVAVRLGSPDIGQGLKTVSAQIVAEELGLDYSKVTVKDISTKIAPNGGVCCASRMTYCVGNSLLLAAKKLKEQMIKTIAGIYNLDHCDLVYEQGEIIFNNGDKIASIKFEEIVEKSLRLGKKLKSEATFTFPTRKKSESLPPGFPHDLYCFGAFIAVVEVDKKLGLVKIREFIGINDAGKIINLSGAEGQVEGGAVMGMGYALMESVQLKPNNRWNDSLAEYLIPTSLDAPFRIKSIFLENEEPSGPYGAKGIGEITTIPVASAISNAIYDATGKRCRSIPITPQNLHKD